MRTRAVTAPSGAFTSSSATLATAWWFRGGTSIFTPADVTFRISTTSVSGSGCVMAYGTTSVASITTDVDVPDTRAFTAVRRGRTCVTGDPMTTAVDTPTARSSA